MEIKKKVVMRTVAGEAMLIPVGDTTAEYNGLFTLSPSAATAFSVLQKGGDENDALNAILEEFDIDRKTAEGDLQAFLCSLKDFNII